MTTPPASIPGASPTTSRITGLAAILAPTLLLASTLGFIIDGNGINDGHLGGMLGVWSCFAFLLAFSGIYRILEPAAPRAAPIMFAVAAIGAAAGVGFNIDAMLAAEFGRETLDTLREDSAVTLFAYLPWGLFFPIGLVGTGILGWRTCTLSRVTAALITLGGVLFVTTRPARIDALAVFGDCVLIVALVPIGLSLLAGRHVSPTADTPVDPVAAMATDRS